MATTTHRRPTTTELAVVGLATAAVAVLWAVVLSWQPVGGVLGAATINGLALVVVALWARGRGLPAGGWHWGRDVWLALPVLAAHLVVSHVAIPAATAVVPLVGEQADRLVFTATSDLPAWVVAVFAAVVVAPMEELYWRGTLQPLLDGRVPGRARWGAWPAIAATTAAFILFHLPTGQLPLMGAAVLGGVAWGWLRARTGGLAAPVIAHAGWSGAMAMWPPG